MDNDFLEKLFALLQISQNDADQFKKDLEDFISYNVTTSFLGNLPNDKKESFVALAKNGKVDKELITKWMQEQNLKDDKELVEKLNAAVEKSYDDFFVAVTQDLDDNKKGEVAEFARSYLSV